MNENNISFITFYSFLELLRLGDGLVEELLHLQTILVVAPDQGYIIVMSSDFQNIIISPTRTNYLNEVF